jgi:hypothetical protein
LNDEIPPTERKSQSFVVQNNEWSRFASCWTGFDG